MCGNSNHIPFNRYVLFNTHTHTQTHTQTHTHARTHAHTHTGSMNDTEDNVIKYKNVY